MVYAAYARRIAFKGRDIALDMLHDGLAWSTIDVAQDRPDSRGDSDAGAPEHDPQHPYTLAEHTARAAGHRPGNGGAAPACNTD